MSYGQQSFNAGQVLQASQMNQVEINIRDHRHGRNGVLSIFDHQVTSNDALMGAGDAGRALFVSATKTVSISPVDMSSGWYAAVFNVSSHCDALVTLMPGSGSAIDGMASAQLGPRQGCLVLATNDGNGIDFMTIGRGIPTIPQNAQNTNYTLAITDAGKHLYHDIASVNLYTIPANSGGVPFPIGTAITFVNANSAGNLHIICSDTLRKVTSGATDTGTRTLAMNGMASALKVSSATWVINGTGLS